MTRMTDEELARRVTTTMTTAPTRSMWLPAGQQSLIVGDPMPSRADVVVVGAGMAGLCTAALCHSAGATVVVIEAAQVADRTTGHSTAKLTSLHGLIYSELIRRHDAEAATQYASANAQALTDISELVTRLGIQCDLTSATAFTCATTPEGLAEVEAEVDAAIAAGLPAEFVTSVDLPIPVLGAVSLAGQAHFNPVLFCRGLASHLASNGVVFAENTRVTNIEESATDCTVTTPTTTVHCDVAVIATHLPVVDPALLSGRVRPDRSYVVAGPSSTATRGMYLAPDAGWSVRPALSHDDGPVLMVGGQGHAMSDHTHSSSHYAALGRFATDELGVDVRHRWSAFDYATTDGLPFIGRLTPGSKRRYVATGFDKWGMTNSMVAAMIISDAIAGRTSRYARTFDSTRIASTLTGDLLKNSTKVVSRFVGDRVRATLPSSSQPGPGEGIVTRMGGKLVAKSVDVDGGVHVVSATCTHLGCVVRFNDGDQTWDCPCHGSRFGLDGTVLDGPATQALEVLDDDVPTPTN
jgi:glycine/D-amino acid oxidase-like deaminating enzyme/nitrite reductase/ring-hydroxylating ferredoxin subunit